MHRILNEKYEKDDLNEVMTKQCQKYPTDTEHHRLLQLLEKFEDLFYGMLGTWNTNPVYLELTDNTKPVCSRPYPVPKVHKTMFKKESERLVRLGFLKKANDYEWGAPSFAQPKAKTNCVKLLSDFWNLNRQLKRKP